MDRSEYNAVEWQKQYSPSAWVKRSSPDTVVAEHCRFIALASQNVQSKLRCQLNISYGPSDRQMLDIFTDEHLPSDAPIFVFIHGGYWKLLSKDEYNFIAVPIVKAGAVFISIDYDLAPNVTITDIVRQVQEAIEYILKLAVSSGSRGVYLSGHSAGAHLAAMAVTADYANRVNIDCNKLIKGIVLVSGLFDLRPLLMTDVNDELKLSEEEAWSNSPANPDHVLSLRMLYPHCRVIVVTGQYDSPEFHKQSEDYHLLLVNEKLWTKLLDIPELDHFNVVENLQEPGYLLLREIVDLMNYHE
jgi:arylformamidase